MSSIEDDNGSTLRQRIVQAKPFTKSFTKAQKFVSSGQQWLHTIPTHDCDVIMTFPAKTKETFLVWMLSLLRQRTPELIVRVRQHRNSGMYAFYMTASNESFLKGAEELSIKKRLNDDLGGGLKEFMVADADCFKGSDDLNTFLSTEERQRVVRHYLYNLRAKTDDHVGKLVFLEGQAIVPILLSHGIIQQVFALHSQDELQYLVKNWVHAIFRSQPIDKVCNYFGVKLAMYFAYLGHYTRALVIPSLFGAAIWYISEQNQELDDIGLVLFAVLNVVWATLYLEHWKRRSAEFAYQWGTLDLPSELLAEPRPLYHGPLMQSKVTGHLEPHYPSWKRNLFRYCVSIPLMLLSLAVVFGTMLSIFMLQDWLNEEIKEDRFPSYFGAVPKVLLAVSIGVFDDVYKKIAYWLNDKENHRLDEAYETNLIIKLVMFQFVNSFLSLFYIAFYLQDMDRLREQLAALLITRQVIGNVKEALIPYILTKVKQFHMGYKMSKAAKGAKPGEEANAELEDETDKLIARATQKNNDSEKNGKEDTKTNLQGSQLTQAEVEASMKEYEDTLEDQLEMFIQFGYVTLFSCAFPLAAVCALLNNIIEIRSDAFKLCTSLQRPFGQQTDGIGIWLGALELMSVIAVLVNCALIGFSGLAVRLLPNYSTAERIVLIIFMEHVILTFKLLLAFAIPDLPEWVTEEKARLEFQQREALKKLESSTRLSSQSSEPTSPIHRTVMSGIVDTISRQQFQQTSPTRVNSASPPNASAIPRTGAASLSTPVKAK